MTTFEQTKPTAQPAPGLFERLAKDPSGNTLALIAASIFPLLAMIGGGVDMGRTYLTQTRLQQACDAGVLAARKKLGSQNPTSMPSDVQAVGDRFFNINFGNGAFGTANRAFTMTLQTDMAISGLASVEVPTTIMQVFGKTKVDVKVSCMSRLNFSNTDIMMVLDTTQSMADTNSGDPGPKIDMLRKTAKEFFQQIDANKAAGSTIRYGFVPYSTNVNVGGLLKEDWMVDKWTYQSREYKFLGTSTKYWYWVSYEKLGGDIQYVTYLADSCPADDYVRTESPYTVTSTSPHMYWFDVTINGDDVSSCRTVDNGKTEVTATRYINFVQRQYWEEAPPETTNDYTYVYKPMTFDLSSLKTGSGNATMGYKSIVTDKTQFPSGDGTPTQAVYSFDGCIEERDTYEIDDYANVDLKRALDLDIDMVPTAGDPRTQWRPQFPYLIFERQMGSDGSGFFDVQEKEWQYGYLNPGWSQYAECPGQAKKLAEMDSAAFGSYVDALPVGGHTYHDIGMIWGGRLLSPTGLFAAENADKDGKPTSRHLIFLTDGETAPLDVSYSSYGVEPLDRRRWDPAAPVGGLSHKKVVEERFQVACNEVKKRNITVWVISFGVELNPIMEKCAGKGRAFEAKSAAALSEAFSTIAQKMGDLRIAK